MKNMYKNKHVYNLFANKPILPFYKDECQWDFVILNVTIDYNIVSAWHAMPYFHHYYQHHIF